MRTQVSESFTSWDSGYYSDNASDSCEPEESDNIIYDKRRADFIKDKFPERMKPFSGYRFINNSSNDGHIVVVGLQDYHTKRFINNAITTHQTPPWTRSGYFLRMGKVEFQSEMKVAVLNISGKSIKGRSITSRVIGDHQIYHVEIVFKESVFTSCKFESILDIIATKCQCTTKSTGEMYKCPHVAALLRSMMIDRCPDKSLKPKFNDTNPADSYCLHDIIIPKRLCPPSTVFPTIDNAFKLPVNKILRYLDHPLANSAAILILGSCGIHWINPNAPLCKKEGHGKMTFTSELSKKSDNIEWKWSCSKCRSTKSITSDQVYVCTDFKVDKDVENEPEFSVTDGFGHAFAKTPALVLKFIITYFTGEKQTHIIAEKLGMNKAKVSKWTLHLRKIIGRINYHNQFVIGDNGSPAEFDGTHIGGTWKYYTGRVPDNWHKTIWFRIIERFITAKGRHRQITFVVSAESVKNCVPYLMKFIKKGTKLFADGCSFGKYPELQKVFEIAQVNHSLRIFSIRTKDMIALEIKHDNIVERSWVDSKTLKRIMFGISRHNKDKESWYSYAWEDDFIANFTTRKGKDVTQTFLEMTGKLPHKFS